MDRVRAFVASSPQVPVSGFLLPDTALRTVTALQGLLARKTLKDLLKTVHARSAAATDSADRLRMQIAVNALLDVEPDKLEQILTRPELIAWIAVAKASDAPTVDHKGADPLAHRLLFVLAPEVLAARLDTVPPPIRIQADTDGRLAVPRMGLLCTHVSDTGWWELSFSGNDLVVSDGTTPIIMDAQSDHVVPLQRIADGPFVVPRASAWLDAFGADSAALTPASEIEVGQFVDYFTEGAELLASHWPPAWAETAAVIEQLVPVRSQGLTPYNFSVHAFRGLIASTPRPGPMAAQILVHETGHNLMSTIIDLLPLCTNPDTRVISPVVNQERALPAVFHGCFSFGREVHLTQLLLEAGVEPVATTDMDKYLKDRTDTVREALNVLTDTADLLPAGTAIVEEVARVLAKVEGSSAL
ncbi:hypothetical protein BJI47_23295 [Rhodococcus sp. 1168]|nr:hypothetical protein BJI47_23295 [Rhodococcus sp. 1168]